MLRLFSRDNLPGESVILRSMASGGTLKVHRYLDGRKVHRMHPLRGGSFTVEEQIVTVLRRKGYIESNMKFPAATYLLTARGRRRLDRLESGSGLRFKIW